MQSIEQCRALHRAVMEKGPQRFSMPVWLFERFVETDLTAMWCCLRTQEIDLDRAPARAIYSNSLKVMTWLGG